MRALGFLGVLSVVRGSGLSTQAFVNLLINSELCFKSVLNGYKGCERWGGDEVSARRAGVEGTVPRG